ncbi:MAG: hypothetical protein GX446_10105 [Chthonomonadales bacterium]|nr:hypothetical protein [Chthonomonadales bacterium]
MATPKPGSRVRIKTRPATPDDAKSGLYYPHLAGLTGTVQHVYEGDEVAVEVEPESLTAEMRARHNSVRDQMKTKWLEGLSEEGRSRLTEREKDFRLRYVVLVAARDLEPAPATDDAASQPSARATKQTEEKPAMRPTSDDLSRAEEEELLRRKARSG